jgi:hypothetical protein
LAQWYGVHSKRVYRVTYEPIRLRFSQVRPDNGKRLKINLKVLGIMGKNYNILDDRLINALEEYFEADYDYSQTRYLRYVNGEFVINQSE